MITGIDWHETQIREKEKQLKKHEYLAKVCCDDEGKRKYEQLAYDDKMYLILLKYSLKNEMEYKEDNIGWCADK